jgi:hypothetical protein
MEETWASSSPLGDQSQQSPITDTMKMKMKMKSMVAVVVICVFLQVFDITNCVGGFKSAENQIVLTKAEPPLSVSVDRDDGTVSPTALLEDNATEAESDGISSASNDQSSDENRENPESPYDVLNPSPPQKEPDTTKKSEEKVKVTVLSPLEKKSKITETLPEKVKVSKSSVRKKTPHTAVSVAANSKALVFNKTESRNARSQSSAPRKVHTNHSHAAVPATLSHATKRKVLPPRSAIPQESPSKNGGAIQVVGSDSGSSKKEGDNLAFVIGNGRTGTNWLGDTLLSHPMITGKNERKPEFSLVTYLAVHLPLLNNKGYEHNFGAVVRQYRRRSQETRVSGKAYHSDKSHPALFFAPRLQEKFPAARFLGMNRCVYPTVASCMRHEGVSDWFKHKELLKVPNKFLGTTEENLPRYKHIPHHVRCALRWVSHQLEYEQVEPILNSKGHNFLLLDYRIMLLNPSKELAKLQSFLGFAETPFDQAPQGHIFDPVSWKKKLTKDMRNDIDRELDNMGLTRLLTTYCHESELS